jgi:hypothetical protein
MKTKIRKLSPKILLAAAALTLQYFNSSTASAQTTNSPTPSQVSPPQNFFQSAEQYFTSANTNYNWAGDTFEVAAGADYMSSVNWANYLDAQYDFGSLAAPEPSGEGGSSFSSRLALEAKIRNAGIAGTVDSVEAGPELTFISYYSVKLEGGVCGGYDLDRGSAIIEPKLTLRDKLTPNTFAGVCLSLPIWINGKPLNNVPDIGLEAGFTY